MFTAGDNVYSSGSLSEYRNCYDRGWGDVRGRTRLSAGDRDYQTPGASGSFDYFGSRAGERGKGYYSYDIGAWHIVGLNSSIDMGVGSPQEQWLRADLAASKRACVLAYRRYPRFSSWSTQVRQEIKPLWDALYEAGAEVVVNGHYRFYERSAPQTPDEVADAEHGIRQFIVGTGGQRVDAMESGFQPRPNTRRPRRSRWVIR